MKLIALAATTWWAVEEIWTREIRINQLKAAIEELKVRYPDVFAFLTAIYNTQLFLR